MAAPLPPRNVAVVLAGGVGTRVGLAIPKQLIKIAGKSIVEHTIEALQQHRDVDRIIVMMTPGYLDDVRAIVRAGGYDKVSDIIEGGQTRNDTTLAALAEVGDDDVKVLFHDAVRPLVSARIITECFEALDRFDAVDVAIPSADTIIAIDPDNTIAEIPPRASLRRGQTPQAFRAGIIRDAYAKAGSDPNFAATDDCTVVLRYRPDVPIWVVTGDERNMKVTEPIDVFMADKLFQLTSHAQPAIPSPEELTSALSGKRVVIFGGSYGIGADMAQIATQHGAHVVAVSRQSGTHVERRQEVAAALTQAAETLGGIDFVVNTAGVLPRGELVHASEEEIYAATEINYLAPIFIAQEAFAHLAASQGSLLLFSSSSYTRGRSGYSLYSSAKAATVNLTQALADEWSEHSVRVNCIAPERTATPMRSKAFGAEPAGSLLASEQVALVSLSVLTSPGTGHIVDVRRLDPATAEPYDLAASGLLDDQAGLP